MTDCGTPAVACPGPLVWFASPGVNPADISAILACHTCGYLIVAGNLNDDPHSYTPMIREGYAA